MRAIALELKHELIGLAGVVERNVYLTRRYIWWDFAFFVWTVANTLTIVFMLGYLFWINWRLTLIAVAAFPIVAYALRRIRKRVKKVSGMVQDRTGTLAHALEEAIGAHRVVKIFGGEAYESGRLREAANRLRLATAKQAAAAALGTPINQIIASIAVGVILYVALRQTSGTYGAGDFITYIFALLHLLTQLKTLTNVTSVIQRGMTAAESVFALIDEPHVRLVDERRRLQRVVAALAPHVAAGDAAELLVDEREKAVERVLVALPDLREQERNVRGICHRRMPREKKSPGR